MAEVRMTDEDMIAETHAAASRLGLSRKQTEKLIADKGPAEAMLEARRRYRRAIVGILPRAEEREQDERAVDAEQRYLCERRKADADRRAEREAMTLGKQIDRIINELRLASEVDAVGMKDRVTSGKSGSRMLSSARLDEPHAALIRRLGLIAKAGWGEVDRIYLRSIGGGRETSDEKDRRLIRDWEGYSSWEVSFADPTLGHPKSVERVRAAHGRKRIDGRATEEDRRAA